MRNPLPWNEAFGAFEAEPTARPRRGILAGNGDRGLFHARTQRVHWRLRSASISKHFGQRLETAGPLRRETYGFRAKACRGRCDARRHRYRRRRSRRWTDRMGIQSPGGVRASSKSSVEYRYRLGGAGLHRLNHFLSPCFGWRFVKQVQVTVVANLEYLRGYPHAYGVGLALVVVDFDSHSALFS